MADSVRVEEGDADSVRLAVSVGNMPLAVGGPLGDSVGATVAESCLEKVGSSVWDSRAEALTGLLGVAEREPVALDDTHKVELGDGDCTGEAEGGEVELMVGGDV